MSRDINELLQNAYQCVQEERWEDAERLYEEVLEIDSTCATAYILLMHTHFRVQTMCASEIRKNLKSRNEIPIDPSVPRKTWSHPDFEELAKKYVVEPYFTREDLKKKCFFWDDDNDNLTDWQIYCANEYKKIETWWHTSKAATGAYRYADESMRRTLDDILKNLKKELVDDIEKEHSDMCMDMWKAFSWKIEDAHEEALQKKKAQTPSPSKKENKGNNTNNNKEHTKKPAKVVEHRNVNAKHDKKAKIASFVVACGYVLLSKLLGLVMDQMYVYAIILLTLLIPTIYAVVKKVMFCKEEPAWTGHTKLFFYAVLIVSILFPITDILGWLSVQAYYVVFDIIIRYVPLWMYLFVATKLPNKKIIVLMVVLCILSFVGTFDSLVALILIHILGMVSVCAVQDKRSAGCVFATSMITIVTNGVSSACSTGDWGYLVLSIVSIAIAAFPWAYFLKDHFAWARIFIKAKAKAYGDRARKGNTWSYDYGSGSGSDIMGDIAASQQQSRDASAAAAQAAQDSRNEADDAYAQSYGFNSKQDAEDHGFM